MQPRPGEPMGTVIQWKGRYAGVWVAGQRDIGVQQKGTDGPWEVGREKCRSCAWDGVSHCPGAGWGLAGWEWLCREGAVLQGETAWFMQFKANQD